MAVGDDPAFQQAMDKLLLQVNADNVLLARRAFQKHADQLTACLNDIERKTTLGRCGLDPISSEVLRPDSLGGKVRELTRVHWEHRDELQAVADRLATTAREYGRTEDEIARSLDGIDTA